MRYLNFGRFGLWFYQSVFRGIVLATGLGVCFSIIWWFNRPLPVKKELPAPIVKSALLPRQPLDTSGYFLLVGSNRWENSASLKEISNIWERSEEKILHDLDGRIGASGERIDFQVSTVLRKAALLMSLGKTAEASLLLRDTRKRIEENGEEAKNMTLANLLYLQGIVALRQGENDNCIMCRGESSCILPIAPGAIHQNPKGSRQAIEHFSEFLREFPDDLEVKWLLNVAHMTLGEYPAKVNPNHLINIDSFLHSKVDIGKFRDIGHLTGINRFNQAGGVVMEDFDNDGLLDLAVTCFDPRKPLAFFRNLGNGKFEEQTKISGSDAQLGGLNCVQADFNNDGLMDLYIPRGAWLSSPIRPTLLRNDGGFHFTDVTVEAGLLDPVNSNCAEWADYDNDGWIDLFICCEKQHNRLYKNLGNGKFKEVSLEAGLGWDGQMFAKGCAWVDIDNDDYPDLFVNYLSGRGQLFRNKRDGTFQNVTHSFGIDGPTTGFSCWAWDFNNDGYMDIFATCYERTLKDTVLGLQGKPHGLKSNKLYLNEKGKGFRDIAKEAGLDMVFTTMGSNFGDFDNDGFLDMYLGTGEPSLSTLIPNRMFKNMGGKRFEEITGSAGVGHLQKGHGVACGDWDRDGNTDVFIVMGGAVDGDRYHNILFQNPGHDRPWITVKLVGQKTNRAALGARIKVVGDGEKPLTVHRHISSGSSFGGNPLQQTIGMGDSKKIATLEVHWPTSQTTQVFHDVDLNQAIEITEGEAGFQKLSWTAVAVPK